MKKPNIVFFRKGDVLLLLFFIILAVIIMLASLKPAAAAPTAVINVDGKEQQRIDLNSVTQAYELSVQGSLPVVLQVEHGRISFKTSGCPDQLCIGAGHLEKNGDYAACLPARVAVYIVDGSENNTGPDFIAG